MSATENTGVTASSTPHISASVGEGGENHRADVIVVQHLLNHHLASPHLPLHVDGNCGPLTIRAIKEFQHRCIRLNPPDGLVEPAGVTFRALTGPKAADSSPGHGVFPVGVIAAAQSSDKTWAIPASVTLAQWALESNWGRAMPQGSNNPFGIKAKAGQLFVEAATHEVVKGRRITVIAKFRKFASLIEAFDQHAKLLATAPAYAKARAQAKNPDAFAQALTGVYATDPDYGPKLTSIMKKYHLYQYDQGHGP